MKRLVYSPKAYVYIQTDLRSFDVPNGVYNISDLVTSGSITRKINQVSTAEVTFQNPGFQFTKPGDPTFHPMDKITIFLQRLPNFPVQTFTGYLDETPYYQMYPGTVTLRASCTLKKLQHTYFDPGLPFMMRFMARYGWVIDADSGSVTNWLNGAPQGGAETVDSAQSASLTDLMFSCLQHIAGLPKEQILIEPLPDSLVTRLAPLYLILDQNSKEATKDFNNWLAEFIGGEQGSGGTGNASGGDSGKFPAGTKAGGLNAAQLKQASRALTVSDRLKAPPLAVLAMVCAGFGESGFDPIMNGSGSDYGGVFQGNVKNGTWKIDDTEGMAESFLKGGKGFQGGGAIALSKRTPAMTPGAIATMVEASGEAPSFYDKFRPQAKAVIKAWRDGGGNPPASGNDDEPADSERLAGGGPHDSQDRSEKIYAPIGGPVVYGRGWHESSKGVTGQTNTSGSTHWHSGVDAAVPGGTPCIAPCDGEITMAKAVWYAAEDKGMVHFKFTKNTGNIKKGTIIGWGHCEKIRVKVGDKVRGGDQVADSGVPSGGAHVHFVQCKSEGGGGDGDTDPVPLLRALQKGETSPTNVQDGEDPSEDANQGSGHTDALAAARAGSAFATLNFPQAIDSQESLLLTGDKALMNDQSLLPFIEELSNGSLRNFMSLPNGDFYCFHPDYFGSLGTSPYWEIDDLEVLDGGIQLSDDALATHVYVIGSTLPGAQSDSSDISVRVGTRGVVNLFNAGTADFLNTEPEAAKTENKPAKPRDEKPEEALRPFLGDGGTVLQFLERYGARPHREAAPFVRSHLFETFYAYQKFMLLWARQFQTTFTFTFMPEIYPGGLVEFKGHGIRMYVDEVNHSWDYESGFTTQANLTAPSADPTSDKKAISRGMVRTALGRPAGSV